MGGLLEVAYCQARLEPFAAFQGLRLAKAEEI